MSNPARVSLIAFLLVALMVPIAGCDGSGPAVPTTPPASSGVGVIMDGAGLVDTLCTKCHTRDRIDQADKDLAEWQTTISRMINQNGAQVTAEQQSAIAIYLSNR